MNAPPPAPNAAAPSAPAASSSQGFRVETEHAARPAPARPAPQPAVAERPVAPARQESAVAPAPASSPSNKDDSDGLFGPFRLGPVVGIGLPNLLSFGGTLKLTRYFGAGVNVGIIPTLHVAYYGDATLSYQEYDVYGRIYPFGGGFFLGAGVGYESVKGSISGDVDLSTYASGQTPIPANIQSLLPAGYQVPSSMTYGSDGSVRTMVLTPQLGYFYVTSSGFSVGFDFGAQVPIAPSQIEYSSKIEPAALAQLTPVQKTQAKQDAQIRDTLEKVGRTPLPTFNLRVGWLL